MIHFSNAEVGRTLLDFTLAEDTLMARLTKLGINHEDLPTRLRDWRTWVGDPWIYLCELKNFAADRESKK